MYLYLRNGCFNCRETIFSERLRHGFPCDLDISEDEIKVFKNVDDTFMFYKKLYELLLKKNRLFLYKDLYHLEEETNNFLQFFSNIVGSSPWTIQLTWFKRLAKKASFSMIAPTGTGKTTFICISSLYFAKQGKKIYIILPTTVLVDQVYEKLIEFSKRSNNEDIKIVAYRRRNQKKTKEQIISGDYDILITSNQFLSRNYDILQDKKFDIIFADDVDALFRGSKNIERVLMLLGFTEEAFTLAYESIKAKRQGNFELVNKIAEDLNKIKKQVSGVLVLSSATGRVKGLRTMLYKELLNFSAGSATTKIRNVVDTYIFPKKDIKEEILNLINILEDGIVIFVPRDMGSEFALELEKFLLENNIKCGVVLSEIRKSIDNIKKFANKELNVLIGVAHFYGLLVRGLDLPTRVKYVIFAGIPKMNINLSKKEKNINSLLTLAQILVDILPEDEIKDIRVILKRLQRSFRRISSDAMRILSISFEENKSLEGWLEMLRENLEKLYNRVSELISKQEILDALKDHPDVSVLVIDKNVILRIPDVKTYIQASGRCSRLYAGGITKGLCVTIVDDEKLLKSLERKLKILFT